MWLSSHPASPHPQIVGHSESCCWGKDGLPWTFGYQASVSPSYFCLTFTLVWYYLWPQHCQGSSVACLSPSVFPWPFSQESQSTIKRIWVSGTWIENSSFELLVILTWAKEWEARRRSIRSGVQGDAWKGIVQRWVRSTLCVQEAERQGWLEVRTEGDELGGHRAWGIALHSPVGQGRLRASLWLPWRLWAVSVCPGVGCPRLVYSSGSPFVEAARLLLKRFPESREDCSHPREVPSRRALRYFWQGDVTAAFWIPLHIPPCSVHSHFSISWCRHLLPWQAPKPRAISIDSYVLNSRFPVCPLSQTSFLVPSAATP